MENNDLSPGWIKSNLSKARFDLARVKESYERLKNKESTYAKGVYRLMVIREKIVKLWEEEL